MGKDATAARHGMHGIELFNVLAKDVRVAVPVWPPQAATGCGSGADGQRLPRVLGRAGIVPGAKTETGSFAPGSAMHTKCRCAQLLESAWRAHEYFGVCVSASAVCAS